MLIRKRSQVSSKSSWYVQLEITDFPEAFNLFFTSVQAEAKPFEDRPGIQIATLLKN